MARKARQWTPNTSYHITCRGNRRSEIFKDKADFRIYLDFLTEALDQFRQVTPYDLLSYCLMDNHVHLLIHTSSNPLGPFIKQVHMKYAMYFNKKYDYTGHLFQGRFYSDPVVGDAEILAASRYIHLNPVAANMVDLPENYAHSSYRFLIGLDKCDFVSSEKVLAPFEKDHAHMLYRQLVESKLEVGV